MSKSKSLSFDLQEISCVVDAYGAEKVNSYLSLGWIIIGTSSQQYSENGYSFSYHLAWLKNLGEPKIPPNPQLPKNWEDIPF